MVCNGSADPQGCTPPVQVLRYVADVLRQQFTRYSDYMSKETDMRRELQRYITTLEVGAPGYRPSTKYPGTRFLGLVAQIL
jgi:hypothetical protein